MAQLTTTRVYAVNAYGTSAASVASASFTPSAPIALFGGGNGNLNVIEKIVIGTSGDATDFGDLTAGGEISAACGSATRGVWFGGERGSAFKCNRLCYVFQCRQCF